MLLQRLAATAQADAVHSGVDYRAAVGVHCLSTHVAGILTGQEHIAGSNLSRLARTLHLGRAFEVFQHFLQYKEQQAHMQFSEPLRPFCVRATDCRSKLQLQRRL